MMDPKEAALFFLKLIDHHDYQESCAYGMDMEEAADYHNKRRKELANRLMDLTQDFPDEVEAAEIEYDAWCEMEAEKG
jgi:hypothetical protein